MNKRKMFEEWFNHWTDHMDTNETDIEAAIEELNPDSQLK